MNGNAATLFNASFSDVERRVPVVVEVVSGASILGRCYRADREAHDKKPDDHECLSGSTTKSALGN